MKSKLILGTVQFGLDYGINNTIGKLSEDQVFELLETAYDLGIRTLDTAEAYGNAHSIISNFHKQSKNKFNIISKYSSSNFEYPIDLVERIQVHCSNFNVNYLEGYMFHSYNDFKMNINNDPNVLDNIKNSGLVKKIGVSVYSNDEIEDLLNFKNINLIQLPFNLFDNEYQRKEILEKAKKRNIEIHTRSVFLQGLFFKDINTLTNCLLPLKNNLSELSLLLKNNNITIESLALNYPLNKTYIDKVLIGVDSLEQLKNNIKATENDFDKSIYEKIDCIQIKNTKLLNPSNWKI
jgi:aryl-alcohol dehydrogenase-like predicted oxidoreductase